MLWIANVKNIGTPLSPRSKKLQSERLNLTEDT